MLLLLLLRILGEGPWKMEGVAEVEELDLACLAVKHLFRRVGDYWQKDRALHTDSLASESVLVVTMVAVVVVVVVVVRAGAEIGLPQRT